MDNQRVIIDAATTIFSNNQIHSLTPQFINKSSYTIITTDRHTYQSFIALSPQRMKRNTMTVLVNTTEEDQGCQMDFFASRSKGNVKVLRETDLGDEEAHTHTHTRTQTQTGTHTHVHTYTRSFLRTKSPPEDKIITKGICLKDYRMETKRTGH